MAGGRVLAWLNKKRERERVRDREREREREPCCVSKPLSIGGVYVKSKIGRAHV